MQPDVLLLGPTGRAVVLVDELADLVAGDAVDLVGLDAGDVHDLHEALVGPPRERHRLIVEEQLQPPPDSGDLAEVLDVKLGLKHVAPRLFGKAREDCVVRYRAPAGHLAAAAQADLGAFLSPVDDGPVRRAGVLGR